MTILPQGDDALITRKDCDHINKRCGIPKCMNRAIYWFVKPSNGGRNVYLCPAHAKEAPAIVSSPWPPKPAPAPKPDTVTK